MHFLHLVSQVFGRPNTGSKTCGQLKGIDAKIRHSSVVIVTPSLLLKILLLDLFVMWNYLKQADIQVSLDFNSFP